MADRPCSHCESFKCYVFHFMFKFIHTDFMFILLGSEQMIHVQIPFFFDMTLGGLVHR